MKKCYHLCGEMFMMQEQNVQVSEKIKKIVCYSLGFMGKKILIRSTQVFDFCQKNYENNQVQDKIDYSIQYGFPQSGSVIIGFSYYKEKNSISVNKISVYTQPADKEFVVANFAPQYDLGVGELNVNFGFDMCTKQYTGLEEIGKNPNALKMLDMFINDLSQAEVIGECNLTVPVGSNEIPLCDAINEPLNTEKR